MSVLQKQKLNIKTSIAGRYIFAVVLVFAYIFAVGGLIVPVNQANATIPKYINFQGKLTQVSDGSNMANGTYAFEFKIYDALTSGTLLWTETFDQPSGACGKLTVTNGVFNAKLGTCNALSSVDFTGGSLYMTINFAPTGTSYDGEMSPRKQLVSSAYAFVANGVSGDGAVNTVNSSATALSVAKSGSNYALQVDTSTASAVTGLKVTSAAAASGLALTTISSGTNENLTIDAKGSGTVSINGSATGDVLFAGGSGSTGCTVTNSTGAFACSADITGGRIISNADATVAASSYLAFNGRSRIYSAADGNLLLQNNATTDFGLLQFGGTSSSFPAIKRNGTGLMVRLADDSAYSNIGASEFRTSNGTNEIARLDSVNLRLSLGANTTVAWRSNVDVTAGVQDVGISRVTTGSIKVTDGGSGYGTLTSAGQLIAGSTSGVVSILPQAAAGTYNFNLPTTAGTSGYVLTSGGGGATAMTWTDPSGLGVRWNAIAAPTGNLSLAHGANTTAFTFNSLTTGTAFGLSSSSLSSGTLLDLTATGTAGLTNQKGLNVSLSGANSTGAQTTYGGYFSNTHSGTSVNVGLYATATTGSSNYAAIFDQGNVGIGTTAPGKTLEVRGVNGTVAIDVSNSTATAVRSGIDGTGYGYILLSDNVSSPNISLNGRTTTDSYINSSNFGFGVSAPDARLEVGGNLSQAAWGLNGINLKSSAATFTDSSTAISGTATNAVFNSFAQPTLAATNTSVTTTNAATVYIANAPTAGTNQTITNPYSLWVDNGTARFDGNVYVSSTSQVGANSNAYISFQTSGNNMVGMFDGNQAFNITNASVNGMTSYWSGRNITRTSGTTSTFEINPTFAPTSGTGVSNTLLVDPTVNQTGGANGISRGVYVNPTLTSSADFRGLESSFTIAGALSSSTAYGSKIAITNNQTTNANTVYGQHISFTDAGSVANLLYGQYVDVTTANTSDTTYAAAFLGGNVGIGDSSPVALLTVGSGDLFQVNSSGAIAAVVGITNTGAQSTTVSSTTALTVANTGTNYAFQVDTSTASSATGLKVKSAAAGGGIALSAISSGTNENMTIDAKGSGSVSIGATSTGDILLGGGSGSTGCTVANSTGTFTCSSSGSFSTNLSVANNTASSSGGVLSVTTTSSSDFVPGIKNTYTQSATGSLNAGYGMQNLVSSTAVVAGAGVGQNIYGIQNVVSKSGADTATGTYNLYSSYNTADNTGRTNAGTVNTYAGYFSALGDTAGTSATYGIYATVSGADNNYAGVFQGGNVGIGTATPNTKLYIQDSSTSPTETIDNTSATGYAMSLYKGTGQQFTVGVAGASETLLGLANKYFIYDYTNSQTRMVIDSTGKLGIGDSTPASLLTVGSGDLFQVNSSGAIAAATGITSSGTITLSGLGGGGTKCVQTDNTGVISAAASACGSGTVRWDQIAAPTAALSLTMPATNETTFTVQSTTQNGFAWQTSTLSSGSLINLSSTSTAAASNTQKVLNVSTSGANSTSTQTTYGGYFSNTHTGTASTNIAGYFTATSGVNSIGVDIQNVSGTTTSTGLRVGTLSATGSTAAAIDLGGVNGGAATTAYGLKIGNSSGGAFVYQIYTGNITGVASETDTLGQLTLGTVTLPTTLSTFTGYGIRTGAISGGTATSNTYGIDLGANSATAASNYGIRVGALSGTATTNIGINIGAVSGGTNNYSLITNGGNVGIGDTSPLSLFTVGSGDLFQVNSSGAIAAATGITSSGTINFSGLTASSAVYTDGSKNLTSTAPSSGTIGYWSRTGTTISPATSGDLITSTIADNTNYNMYLQNTGGTGKVLRLNGGTGSTTLLSVEAGSTPVVTVNAGGSNGVLNVTTADNTNFAAVINNSPAGSGRVLKLTSGSTTANIPVLQVDNGTPATIFGVYADGKVGVGDSTPASLLTVGSGDLFQVNSSGAIAAATGITSSGTINFSGLTASSAVYTDGSKNLTSTAPTSGTIGYWSRTGTTITPATANDIVTMPSNITTGAGLALSSTGVYTGTGILNVTANSATSGVLGLFTSSSLTSGSLLSLTSNGTAAANNQTGLNISLQGTNATGGITSYGANISNTHAGSGTNIGLQLAASGGSSNTALLTTAGNVQIGTGNILVTRSDTTATLQIQGGNSGLSQNGDFSINVGGGSREFAIINNNASKYLLFSPGGSGTGSSNIGINTTAPGNYNRLRVVQDDATASQTRTAVSAEATGAGSSSTNVGLYASATGATNNYAIIVPASSGRVGIGLSSPLATLHVYDTIQVGSNGAANGYIRSPNNLGFTLDTDNDQSGNYFLFENNATTLGTGTELMRIQEDGKVGIGTSGPDRKLDVLDASNPQIRLTTTDGSVYGELQNSSNTILALTGSNLSGSSGTQYGMQINPTIAQSSTAGYTSLLVNTTESSTGSGAKNLLDLQVGGSSKATFDNTGMLSIRGGTSASEFQGIKITHTGVNYGSNPYIELIPRGNPLTKGVKLVGASTNGTNTADFQLQLTDDSATQFTAISAFGGTGNVGIGITSDPGALLGLRFPTLTGVSAERPQLYSIQTSAAIGIGSGATITNWRHNLFATPVFAGVAGGLTETITNAANVYIEGGPANLGNLTMTNSYALWVDSGTSRFDGTLNLSSITGSTQCLQVNTSGDVSGTGSSCGGSLTVGTSAITSGGTNRVLFENGSNVLSENANFTYDGTTLGVVNSSTTASNKVLNISQTGATAGTDYGGFFSNTGAATTNVGLYSTASGGTNNYAAIFDAGSVGIGVTSSLVGKLHVVGSTTASGATAVAGVFTDLTLTNGTASGFEYGNRNLVTVNGGTAGTNVGQFIRMTDNTALDSGQVVRGLEVQAFSGSNTGGVNTGIASYGYTFGLQATTTAQAAAQAAPAAIFADLDNGTDATTKARGNAIRAYTDNATSATLVQFYQESSAYTGTGLQMNFGNNSGSFVGNFADYQYQNTSKYTFAYSSSTSKSTETFSATGSTTDYASATNGNTYIIKIPQKATTGTCASAAAEGLIYQNSAGTQVGHMCIDGPSSGTPNKLRFYAEQFNATSTDVAENYSDVTNTLAAGDVVMLDTSVKYGVTKAFGTNNSKVIGIVATSPGILLTGVSESNHFTELVNPKPVALAGRVPVKVINENGPIKAGDFLTSSSTPGYAMRATQAGPVIGQALEDFDGVAGLVDTFVKATNYNGANIQDEMVGLNFNYGSDEQSQEVAATNSEAILAHLLEQLSQIDTAHMSQVQTDLILARGEIVTPTVTTHTLRTDLLSAATTNGGIVISSEVVLDGGLKVDTIGSIGTLLSFKSDVEFFGTPYFTSDTAGFAVVKAGVQSVDVTFTREYIAQPIVNATVSFEQDVDQDGMTEEQRQALKEIAIADAQSYLADPVNYIITNKSKYGFTIVLNKPATRDIKLSWTALAVRNATTFMSLNAPEIPSAPSAPAPNENSTGDSGSVAGDTTGGATDSGSSGDSGSDSGAPLSDSGTGNPPTP